MDFNWFQLGPIPHDVISGYYNPWLVALSYCIAVLASYVTLDLAGQLRAEQSNRAKAYWLVGGAFTMGAGIWSMHFIGMLAFIMPMPAKYSLIWTSASLFVAMLASALALFILRKKHNSNTHLVMGGIFIGLGIATMHYMGMEGMRAHVNIHYLPGIFFLSIAIAIFAAEAALWLALQSNKGAAKRQFNLKIISALIMGIAICGMHYTGMAAAIFTPNMSHEMSASYTTIQPDYLAFFIAGITAVIISFALTVSTYYKQMISAIQNEKEFLNAMLNNLEDIIIACDANGKITVVNQAIQKYVNAIITINSINDLHNYFDLYTLENEKVTNQNMPLNRSFNGEQIHDLKLIIKFINNINRDVVINGQQIIDNEKNNLGAVMVIHDVTELKQSEKLKNEFVSIVSHELRTPLTSIRGSLGLLTSGTVGDIPEKAKKLIEIANNNCERLLLLINDILDIEKIEAGKMEFQLKMVDLNKVVSDSIDANKMYAEKFNVSLKIIHDVLNIRAIIDPDRLMQVLANLISNACKFSPKGSEVTIRITQENNIARVSVSDQGPGISADFQTRIFQKFSQADSSSSRGKGGTGLGLNISKAIIEKLGGKLGFTSIENEGTTFYFDLPISIENSVETKKSILCSNQKKLLICEDDQDQAEYLYVLLESAGFTSDKAYTVAQAKELLTQNEYQAILLDLILPDQDGISFIRELRVAEATRHLPIIVLSVIAQTGKSLLNGDAVSLIDWLDKPIDFNKLITSIQRMKKTTSDKLPHILHIEDDVDTQHVIALLLKDHAAVTTASTLKQAKEFLKNENFDLVILDLLLPDGNGVEIIPMLAKYKIPILVFSATALDQSYAKSVSQVLVKANSSNEQLLATITNLLHKVN